MARYGVREIVDVVFKDIETGEPRLYLETLKTSSNEVTAEQVAARGGSGNPKRIVWDSNKEVVYNMQDALISPESFAMLAGSDLVVGSKLVPKKEVIFLGEDGSALLEKEPSSSKEIFVFETTDGTDIKTKVEDVTVDELDKAKITSATAMNKKVIVDYYYEAPETTKSITIDAGKFPGYYRIEAKTLWRNEETGKDLEAIYTMPKIKMRTGFTISNAAEGEPSVFDFVCDVFPDEDGHMETIDILE